MRHELARSKVTRQDQTSVPAEVRKRFGFKSGCELSWFEEDGRLGVDLVRTHTLADAQAALQGPLPHKSDEDIREAIGAYAADRFLRAGR